MWHECGTEASGHEKRTPAGALFLPFYLDFLLERKTGFEPATLTLAR